MSRRDKRRRFASWLVEMLPMPARFASQAIVRSRSILVEPLESRQLMAADGFMALLGSAQRDFAALSMGPTAADQQSVSVNSADFMNSSSTSFFVGEGEGSLRGEGEDTSDLVAFARALRDSGTRFFGAAWCPFCTDQKELFEDGYQFLPFVEVTNPDRSPNAIATAEGITVYPTWEFPDGSRVTGVQTLETLSQRSGVAIPQSSTPSIAELGNVSVGIGSPLHIPIDAYDPNGDALTITVTSSNPSLLTATVTPADNRSLRISTEGFGDMVFELFEDKAPRPASRVIELAEDGFYDGIIFHRVLDNFVIQGGDPTGTGSGGSTLGDFDDQFHLDLQHNRTGVLSYAKSTDDTNDSQFFITEGPQRRLDFNHSIFGQLIEGEQVREAISNTAVNNAQQGRPINPVVIESATVFSDTENGTVLLRPTGSGTGTVTITVTVADGEGNSTSRTFDATVVEDTANGSPFLNPIPAVETTANTPVTINLSAQDAENDTLVYSVQRVGTENYTVSVDSNTGVVSFIPPSGFTGELQFSAAVRQITAPFANDPEDSQLVTVVVGASQAVVPAPTGIDLNAASDSGISATDNITNASTLTFDIAGTTAGATVEVLSSGNVVGSATATGGTTAVVVSVAGLGQGSVLFTARQRIEGNNSTQSAGLAVTLDNQAPATLASGAVPTSAIVNQALNVDLSHSEEGQGVSYSVQGAPSGLTVGAQDGVLDWTPTQSQLGPQSLTLVLSDAAGNTTDQQITINVVDQPLVRVSLNAVDLNGLPITTVNTGQEFRVQVVVSDLRGGSEATGVFATYVDLLFDDAVIEPIANDPIRYLDPYLNDLSGSTATPGLIDELGAFSDRSSRLGSESRVLAEVTFRAKVAGNPNLRTESPDESGNDVLLYDVRDPIAFSRVDFTASPFVVGADFVVNDDSFNFDEDAGTQSLNVLSNDTVSGAAVLTIVEVGATSGGGAVTIAADGRTLNYTSVSNFNGAESFAYTVRNQEGVRLTGTVTVQVTDINDPPVALNDTFTVIRNSTQNVLEVMNNDSTGVDPVEAETLTIASVSAGSAGGTIERGPSGLTVRYTPASNFQGTETFTYVLSDGRGGTATATVSVSVNPENPPPTALNDTFTVEEDAALALFDVLANDSTDNPAETLRVSAVGSSQVGSFISISSDGLQVQYRPAPNFDGSEVISYTLRDSGGATAVGQITFNISPVNDPPDAIDDSLTALSGQASTELNVLANDVNPDTGETLRIAAVSQPPSGSGSIAISSNGSRLIYTPPSSSFEGNFSFTYTIDDGTGLTDTATVALNVASFVPRSVSGRLLYGSGGSDAALTGVLLSLNGTDATGANVSRQVTAGQSGAFNFTSLAPGQYTLDRSPLPFLEDDGQRIELNSGVTDGDVVSDIIVTGALRASYFNIRDFLGSTTRNNLTIALNADGTTNWMASRGDWAELDTLSVTLDSTGNQLQFNASENGQQNLQGSLSINGSGRVTQIAQESSQRLLRVRTSASEAGLAVPTPNAAAASTTVNSDIGQALLAEGEGPSDRSDEADSVESNFQAQSVPISNSRFRRVSSLTQAPQAAQNPDPQTALRSLLGSSKAPVAVAASSSAASAMSAAAVDRAMEDVLPTLQMRLTDDLETTLG